MKRITVPVFIAAALLASPTATGTNIDPNGRYGWGENVGWNDSHGDGVSSGATVSATFLSGSVWLENAGWLILGSGTPANGVRYSNTSGSDFGVNVGNSGDLSGYAWGENIGWVNFDTSSAGSDRARLIYNNRLAGFAWGENIGWISLGQAGPGLAPSGPLISLDPNVPPTAGIPTLSLNDLPGSGTVLSWTLVLDATAYDVVEGDLQTLQSSRGDFTAATNSCLANNLLGSNSIPITSVPPASGGWWYLVRGSNRGGNGTYDSLDVSQAAPRDATINASRLSCP